MTQLSALLNRGQLFEHAAAAADVALDRPAMTILVILDTAGLAEWSDRDRAEFVRLLGRMVDDLTAQLDTVIDSKTADA
ncbi:hypothetical protein [Streptomyces griseocarneus]|uniref:hypothetical protein n=1 Tax=Streptomyces griseocarneus TaxID=51201 RepID=UPI00167CFC90|nr:hypothetical protein [Streptomyces griseocarneus]MBZ6476164.1 hypothetical protein [Streptomyces griseocarneus]